MKKKELITLESAEATIKNICRHFGKGTNRRVCDTYAIELVRLYPFATNADLKKFEQAFCNGEHYYHHSKIMQFAYYFFSGISHERKMDAYNKYRPLINKKKEESISLGERQKEIRKMAEAFSSQSNSIRKHG